MLDRFKYNNIQRLQVNGTARNLVYNNMRFHTQATTGTNRPSIVFGQKKRSLYIQVHTVQLQELSSPFHPPAARPLVSLKEKDPRIPQ